MARSNRDNARQHVQEGYGDYRHDNATRKNNPPSGMTGQGQIEEHPAIPYSYDPHLPPVLRFDTENYADILKGCQ